MRRRRAALAVAASVAAGLLAAAPPAWAQKLNVRPGVEVRAVASTNPDLRPKGQEQGDAWIEFDPYVLLSGTVGQRFRLSGGANLGASLRLSTQEGATSSGWLRPNGSLVGTWEAVENWLFVDVRASARSELDNPFLATTDPTSPFNTSTSYQLGVSPYIRGRLPAQFNYEVRSDNSWTDSPNSRGQYSAVNTIEVDRPPQPLGGALVLQQQLLSSDVEGQSRLSTETARVSLRYALTTYLTLGARAGAERYNFTVAAREWQRYYGAEISWRPNERTSLEGYWEDRVFGNSWNLAFSYRRPRAALSVSSTRQLSSTPQQFLTFPGLSNVVSLLDAALTTRIPDPVARQRAVIDFLSQSQLPQDLLTPTIIYTENFTIQEVNSARLVVSGRRDSLAFTLFQTVTQASAGISATLPVASKTLQNGTELSYSRQLTPVASLNAGASWRQTRDQLATSQQTTQTQLTLETSRTLARGATAILGTRYQWITSTVTNDATEAALYFTLNYRFD
jgi:uncharacterized protein (PEP-CTERM system associated)